MLKTIVAFSNSDFQRNKEFYNNFIKTIEQTGKYTLIHKWYEKKESEDPTIIYSRFLKELKIADVVIAEVSSPSTGVGQTIAVANQNKKNIIICMKRDAKDSNLHLLVRGITSPFAKYIYYDNLSDFQKKLVKLYDVFNKTKFEKFNFLATPEIKDILSEESRKLNITQSELLRNIITQWSKKETENNNRFSVYAATYLVLIKDKKILLLRRFNTGWEDGKYTLISGHIDGNETISQAMSREAFEETGIKINPEDLEVIHIMHRKSTTEYIDFFLVPSRWEGIPEIKEKDKADDIQWFNINSLPDNLLPNVSFVLSQINSGKTFSEYPHI